MTTLRLISSMATKALLADLVALYQAQNPNVQVQVESVGGVDAGNLSTFRRAGARGAGLGSSLYTPGIALDELRRRAQALVAAWAATG